MLATPRFFACPVVPPPSAHFHIIPNVATSAPRELSLKLVPRQPLRCKRKGFAHKFFSFPLPGGKLASAQFSFVCSERENPYKGVVQCSHKKNPFPLSFNLINATRSRHSKSSEDDILFLSWYSQAFLDSAHFPFFSFYLCWSHKLATNLPEKFSPTPWRKEKTFIGRIGFLAWFTYF